MIKASRISFNEPKRLPSLDYLMDEFDLVFDVKHLCLKKKNEGFFPVITGAHLFL
jgi:hypothetical protein